MKQSTIKKNKYEIDMCNSPLFGKIVTFTIPVMLSGILQLLFNAADTVVVGRFAGSQALAAVGSTGSLINLLVNLFMGFSVGTNVLASRYYGAKQSKDMEELVHTAITTALLFGLFIAVFGCLVSKPMLSLMGTPDDVIELAVQYIRIYFIGAPIMLVYNFGSAVLRAIGDTKRPLYYLSIAGVINVILNLIFVVFFHMSAAGVALATILSQVVSMILVIRCLMNAEGDYQLHIKRLRIAKHKLIKMAKLGLPAGIQSSFFAVSNVIIQSSINSFGSIAMAGNTVAANVENFVYIAMNAFYQTAISFTGQNFGARKYRRIGKIQAICFTMTTLIGLIGGNLAILFAPQLFHLYTSDPEVIAFGILRISILCVAYFFCGTMEVVVGTLRGIGLSIVPMIVSLTGACLFRIAWISTIFQNNPTPECLYYSYPISWALTTFAHLICFFIAYHKLIKSGMSVD